MEQETILYYYPLAGQSDSADNTTAAKKHWFQEAVLQTRQLGAQEEFCVMGCAIPPFYYRKKEWRAPVLFEAMEAALQTAAGMTDTCVHPDILRFLEPKMWERWQPCARTIKLLLKYLLEQQAEKALARTGMVTVLLGQIGETEQQLQTIRELLAPYLPRVNRMLLYYEGQETLRESRETELEDGGKAWRRSSGYEDGGETVGEDEREMLQDYTEEYYYEYGLVVQLIPYNRVRAAETTKDALSVQDDSVTLRCGKERCGGLILDYSDGFRYPKLMSEGVYIDVVSDGEKERLVNRKSPAIPYVSPLKYLDTLVKNSYDRKVKMK